MFLPVSRLSVPKAYFRIKGNSTDLRTKLTIQMKKKPYIRPLETSCNIGYKSAVCHELSVSHWSLLSRNMQINSLLCGKVPPQFQECHDITSTFLQSAVVFPDRLILLKCQRFRFVCTANSLLLKEGSDINDNQFRSPKDKAQFFTV